MSIANTFLKKSKMIVKDLCFIVYYNQESNILRAWNVKEYSIYLFLCQCRNSTGTDVSKKR